jgi:NitT/TauT family transport system ATP-binding protein
MILELQAVGKSYSGRPILDGIDLRLNPGDCVRLVGPSGLGKSTLLEIAAGLTPPDAGRVIRSGTVAMTFQDDALLPWASAADNLLYALAARPSACTRIPDWLAHFELPPGLLPAEMSGGMRRRLSLARAFAAEAAVLLLDEPFAFLDAGWRARVAETIDDAVTGGAAVLFSTHQSEETPRACRRSISIENGRIVAV